MPVRAENKDIPSQSVVVEKIDEQLRGVKITGAHLVSSGLKSGDRGNGYVFVPFGQDKNLQLVAVIDILLRGPQIQDADGQTVDKLRILGELSDTVGVYARSNMPPRNEPRNLIFYLCQNIESFYPYLRQWRHANRLSWGFSVAAALVDPTTRNVRLASTGRNLVAKEWFPDSRRFQSIFLPDRRSFLPTTSLDGEGGGINVKTANARLENTLLLATDRIIANQKGLWPFSGLEVNVRKRPEDLLGENYDEALYVVVRPLSPSST